MVINWILSISRGNKIAFYKSDISGAFDPVFTPFLLAKLRSLGIPDSILDFLQAYLAPRIAHVAIGGERSEDFVIENSVYQGTVLGPMLWNTFSMDVIFAARSCSRCEIILLTICPFSMNSTAMKMIHVLKVSCK